MRRRPNLSSHLVAWWGREAEGESDVRVLGVASVLGSSTGVYEALRGAADVQYHAS